MDVHLILVILGCSYLFGRSSAAKATADFLMQVALSEYLPDDYLPQKVLFYPGIFPEQGCHYSQRALIGSLQMIILYIEVF